MDRKIIIKSLDSVTVHRLKVKNCDMDRFSSKIAMVILLAVFAHLDKNEGKNYFVLFIAASGGVGKNLPIMRELLSNKHGASPLMDQHFYLWGGKRNRSHGENMSQSQTIIEGLGGEVDILRIGREGHGGFNHNLQYQEEALALWNSLCHRKNEK